ncbi:hypothetical protein [Pyrobaculum sp.]|uniref:hypothetical protein n=1 Tax=Pyrobaculum sp. TaxID=2004705 RepID=UPI003D135040
MVMTVRRFSRRGRGVAVVEPRDLPESEASLPDRFYESYGIGDAVWIREVDSHGYFIVVLPPMFYTPPPLPRGEIQWPEWL